MQCNRVRWASLAWPYLAARRQNGQPDLPVSGNLRENANASRRPQSRPRKARTRPVVARCRHPHDAQRRNRQGDGGGRFRLAVSRHGARRHVARSLRADLDRRTRRRHRPDRARAKWRIRDRDPRAWTMARSASSCRMSTPPRRRARSSTGSNTRRSAIARWAASGRITGCARRVRAKRRARSTPPI